MKNVKNDVLRLLNSIPETRADDMVLYSHYVSERGYNDGDLANIFANPKLRATLGLANITTVSRMRRKLQQEQPELRPSETQLKIRKQYEKEFREFFKKPLCLNCE